MDSPRTSYKIGPPNLSFQMILDRSFLIPRLRTLHQGRERFKMHQEMLIEEKCHIYAGVLFCFCGECRERL